MMRNSETVNGLGRRCPTVTLLAAGLALLGFSANAAEVFDAAGNRVFHTFDGDEVEVRDRDSVTRYLEQFLHQDDSGQVFELHDDWEIVSDGTAGFHVSFDVDGCDPTVIPGSGTLVPGGVSFREAHLLMEMLADDGRVKSLDVVELNPILDLRNCTAEMGVGLVASLMGEQIITRPG